MILYFNKNGQLLEQLEYGAAPRVGMTTLQIFAYFEGIDLNSYGAAIIRFRRPDLEGSEYPNLFMVRCNFTYDSSVESSDYFKVANNPYGGYIFRFDTVKDDISGEIITMLDTPGIWEATIVLVNSAGGRNVVGMVKFSVAGSVSDADEEAQTLDYEVINSNISQAVSTKVDKSDTLYLRYSEDFIKQAQEGTLLKRAFLEGTDVFDQKTLSIYHIEKVEDNPDITTDEYVFATRYTSQNMLYFSGYVAEIVAPFDNNDTILDLYNAFYDVQRNFGAITYNGDKYFCIADLVGENLYSITIWNTVSVWKNNNMAGSASLGSFMVTENQHNFIFDTNADFVKYSPNQGLNDTQKANARSNIGAGTSSFSGNYSDLAGKPDNLMTTNTDQWNITGGKTFKGEVNIDAAGSLRIWSTPTENSDAATKEYVDSMVTSATQFKGTVANVSDLPASGNVAGDMYWVTAESQYYIWNGTTWSAAGGSVDLSNYYTKGESDSRFARPSITNNFLHPQKVSEYVTVYDDAFSQSHRKCVNYADDSIVQYLQNKTYNTNGDLYTLTLPFDTNGGSDRLATERYTKNSVIYINGGQNFPKTTKLEDVYQYFYDDQNQNYERIRIIRVDGYDYIANIGPHDANTANFDLISINQTYQIRYSTEYVATYPAKTSTFEDILTDPYECSFLTTKDDYAKSTWVSGNFQPLDADLTAIAGLSATSVGLLEKTGNNQWSLDNTYGFKKVLYIGETTTESLSSGDSTNPITIDGNLRYPSPGNIVLSSSQYFIWTGSTWQLLANVSKNANRTGSTNDTQNKLFIVGAKTQETAAETNSNENCYVNYNRLYSGGQKTISVFTVTSLQSTTLTNLQNLIGGTTSPYVGIMNVATKSYLVSLHYGGLTATPYTVEIIPICEETSTFKYFAKDLAPSTTLDTVMSSTYAVSYATEAWVQNQGYALLVASNTFQGNNGFYGITSFVNNDNHSMVSISKDTTVAMYFYTYNSTSQTVNTHPYTLGFENAAPSADRALQLPDESGVLATRTWVQNQGYVTPSDVVTISTSQTITGAKTFTASNTFVGNNSFNGITSFTNNNGHSMVSISKDTTVAMYFYTRNSTSQTVNTHFYSLGFENAAPSADRALQLPNESGVLATRTWVQSQGYISSVTSAMVTSALGYTPASADTKNTTGTTNKTGTKMYLVGATEQSANPQTYSNSNCYIGTDNCLYSGGTKVLTSHQSLSGYLKQSDFEYNSTTRVLKLKWL